MLLQTYVTTILQSELPSRHYKMSHSPIHFVAGTKRYKTSCAIARQKCTVRTSHQRYLVFRVFQAPTRQHLRWTWRQLEHLNSLNIHWIYIQSMNIFWAKPGFFALSIECGNCTVAAVARHWMSSPWQEVKKCALWEPRSRGDRQDPGLLTLLHWFTFFEYPFQSFSLLRSDPDKHVCSNCL